MRRTLALILFAAGLLAPVLSAGPADAPPPPILEPAPNPTGGAVRVRVPIGGGEMKAFRCAAQVPRAPEKGKTAKKEMIDVTVGLDTGSHESSVTAKKLQSWGYTVAPNQDYVVLPEVGLTGSQLAPKVKDKEKGWDVRVKVANVRCRIYPETANGGDQILGTDMLLAFRDAAGIGPPHTAVKLARLYVTDRFLDLNELPAALTRPGGGDEPGPLPPSQADPKLAVFVAASKSQTTAVFAQAWINGIGAVKHAGMVAPLNVTVSTVTFVGPRMVLSIGAARELGVEVDQTKTTVKVDRLAGTGGLIPTKVGELRIRVGTGKDYKTQKDIVFKDVPTVVDTFQSAPEVLIGPAFLNKYLPDGVLTLTEQPRVLKLYGRVSPDALQPPKDPVPAKKP